ncbi:hypothetical protein [Clostridium tepidum]|nr:hypothetical protein [Clostridium tepidum]
MKNSFLKNIFCFIILLLFFYSFFNLVPIKYNKSTKEYNGYYYSTELKKLKSEKPIKVKFTLKSYTKFDLFKLNKSNKFKGELLINDTKYEIKKLNIVDNKYIGTFSNNNSNNNFSVIFISKDLNKVSINYNKSYDIWCTNKNLDDIKSFRKNFLD